MTSLDRRHFLTGAIAGAGAIALGGEPTGAAARARNQAAIIQRNGGGGGAGGQGIPRAGEVSFAQGVASGQSTPRGITLWTLAAGIERDSRLELEVEVDANFRNVILRRDVIVRKNETLTVHARIDGGPLRPGEQYFYRFSSRSSDSEVGRFRTSLRPTRASPCGSASSRVRPTTPASTPPMRGSPRRTTSTTSSASATTSTRSPSTRMDRAGTQARTAMARWRRSASTAASTRSITRTRISGACAPSTR